MSEIGEISIKIGKFMTKYIDIPLEQAVGIWGDKLKYKRWENQLNFIIKAKNKFKELGLKNPPKELQLKLGLPLLEASSLEDDDYLQNLWANLLVNGTTDFSLERSHIVILEQLTSLEAQILIKIYSHIKFDGNNTYRIDVSNYPKIEIITDESSVATQEEVADLWDNLDNHENIVEDIDIATSSEINLALSNLMRLNCLLRVITFGGGENFNSVHPTIFGANLYEAVHEPKKI
ncbi:MAG: Abi-alpha family protein [Sulfurovum sp.]|nr:Abi-alpha family protein [Sulfurovum sp.]